MSKRKRIALGLLLALPACARFGPEFRCTQDSQCVVDGVPGTCEPNRYCSLPDGSCSSGQRYRAAGLLDGVCTDAPPDLGDSVIGDDLASVGGDLASPPDLSSGPYPTAVLQDTPVGYFRLGEKSGSVVADATGGPTGNIIASPILGVPGALAGDPDTAFDFAAAGRCSLGDRFTFAGTAPFSVEAWIMHKGSGDWHHVVTKQQRSGPKQGWALLLDPTGIPFLERYVADAGLAVLGNAAAPLNVWTHLVATYDGATLRFYVNGVQTDATADARVLPSHTTPALIGDSLITGEPGYRFNGEIDEVAVYDHALSLTRIQAHWAAGQ